MKYSPRQYATALLDVLDGKSEREKKKLFLTFLGVLKKQRAFARMPYVLREVEREDLKRKGLKKVFVESASPMSVKIKKEIHAALGKKLRLEEKTNPELLAGITILVDDELLVDASGRRRLEKIFSLDR